MSNPFTPGGGEFPGRPGFGFGFGPAPWTDVPCTPHGGKPDTNSANTSATTPAAGASTPVSAAASAPVSGLASAPVSVPASASAGGRRGGWGRGGPGRGKRGDVRAAILKLLAERPMHGYEMIQQIAERSNGLWKPSPGSVYPTLQLLDDEGLITASETDGSKKLFELTDTGRAAAEKVETPPWEEITEGADPGQVNLRAAIGQLFGAVAQSAHTATEEQQQRIVELLNNARREVYGILGED